MLSRWWPSRQPEFIHRHRHAAAPNKFQAHGHELIVVGHRGHFFGDYLLGRSNDRVIHHAHRPGIVVR